MRTKTKKTLTEKFEEQSESPWISPICE